MLQQVGTTVQRNYSRFEEEEEDYSDDYSDDDGDEEYEYDDEDFGENEGVIYRKEKLLPLPKEIRYWTIVVAQLNYLATRKFVYAYPLTMLYEVLSTIIMYEKGYEYTSFFLARIVLIFLYLTLDVVIQYTFDLTYIAGVYVLYLALVWIITLGSQIILPMKYVTYASFGLFSALTISASITSIFAEPWVWVVIATNTVVVFLMIILISHAGLDEHVALVMYLSAWVFTIIIYRYGIGERNDSHDFDHYF